MKQKSKFQIRPFISASIVLLFVTLIISSIVVFFEPAGRDAYWVDWQLFGLNKTQWDSLHIINGFLFIILSIIHLILNWKTFIAYIKKKTEQALNRKWEILSAVLLVILFSVGSLTGAVPFSSFLNWGDAVGENWVEESQKAPIPHMELFTLEDLSLTYGLDFASAVTFLTQNGYVWQKDASLEYVAILNQTAPADIFAVIKPYFAEDSVEAEVHFGRMTIQELADWLQTDTEPLIDKIQAFGGNASVNQRIKDVALDLDLTPELLVEKLTQ